MIAKPACTFFRRLAPTRQVFATALTVVLVALATPASVASERYDSHDHSLFHSSHIPSGMTMAAGAHAAQQVADHAVDLVMRALSLLGVNYKRGGDSPQTGLDCSGLVTLVFRETLGLVLPRRSEEISRVGRTVQTNELQPGDLVFYNTLRRTFSHVGIYLGDGRFIHAPASGGNVRIESMDLPYWSKRFNGARRVVQS